MARATALRLLRSWGEHAPTPSRWRVVARLQGSEAEATLEVPGDVTWWRLALTIVDAIGWCFDHSWEFGVPTAKHRYHPLEYGTPLRPADGGRLWDIEPRVRDKLVLHFDFGDHNLFDLKITASLAPSDRGAECVAFRGERPLQYGSYVDDFYDVD